MKSQTDRRVYRDIWGNINRDYFLSYQLCGPLPFTLFYPDLVDGTFSFPDYEGATRVFHCCPVPRISGGPRRP